MDVPREKVLTSARSTGSLPGPFSDSRREQAWTARNLRPLSPALSIALVHPGRAPSLQDSRGSVGFNSANTESEIAKIATLPGREYKSLQLEGMSELCKVGGC